MKAGELMQLLGLDPNAEVILQKDAEGNGYSPLAGLDAKCVYVPNNTYSGEVYEASEGDKRPRCVVLYPVN